MDCLRAYSHILISSYILGSVGRQLFDGMPPVIPSFVDVVGSFGRQLFHRMPQIIPSFVDVVGCFGRQLFH